MELVRLIKSCLNETKSNVCYVNICMIIFLSKGSKTDRLCGLVVRDPGYRSRGSGLCSRHYQIFFRRSGSGTEPSHPRDYN
jgi:hypothetical protein